MTMLRASLAPLCALILAGCGGMHNHGAMMGGGGGGMARGMPDATARATLEPTRGNNARGTVMFMQHGDTMMVHAMVSGLTPNQMHGFHIHEKGDCSSGDGMSTGGHFNPTGKPHGPQDADHHAGDLPALQADAQGKADQKFSIKGVAIGAGAADIVGRGLIVHISPDDYKTQPTGNSGARIACAVIERMR